MVDILAMLESEKWWIAVGVGEMVEHNHNCGCSKIGGLSNNKLIFNII
jgi:hypothetical protein